MMIQIPQCEWEKCQREYRELRKNLGSRPTAYLEGMLDVYSGIVILPFGEDSDKENIGKSILIQRELSKLTYEELKEEAREVNPIKEFFQSWGDAFGHNFSYARREIAKDLLGRKGLPYFVVKDD